jgi:Dolichyl-phosphate-mannose-protein mannosyltransferase
VRDKVISILQRTDCRLLLFGLSAVIATYLGFLGLGVEQSAVVIRRFGYYFMLLTFALWVATLWALWRSRTPSEPLPMGEWLAAGCGIGLLSLIAISAETFRCKVLFDEFVLQSTAYNMHYFRDAATMVRGYDILGVFVSTDSYLDKRPNFFPFLISLVHDLTGYRPTNAYALNALLLPVTLSLVYYLGRRLNGCRGGVLAVLLLGSLPLLGQNATGSGMELLNVAMILAVAGLGAAYLREPDEIRLSALVIGAVLLAQTRYESAIYVGLVALLIGLSWWREKQITLSWMTILAPLLLIPSALQNKVLSNTKWMWELKENQNTRFSVDYLAGNVRSAAEFFFNTNPRLANSLPLAILGVFAGCYLLGRVPRIREILRRENSDSSALLILGIGAAINTFLIMFYYWSSLTDPLASRLSLPFYLILAFLVVIAAAGLDRRLPASLVLVGVMATFALGVTTSRAAFHIYSHLGIDEIEWEKRFVAARPAGNRLVISNTSTIPWLLVKTPSILIGRTFAVADRLKYQLELNGFSEILVFQSYRPTTVEGDHELVPEDRLPPGCQLEFLMEKRFGTKIVRASRLVGVVLPQAKVATIATTP